jgi:flavin reductase (DIM6/NTAB) family NADH-FMN oxidoreductase RutF
MMLPNGELREMVKRVVFGPPNFAQQYPLGMRDPQSEVVVRLSGIGAPIDVTHRHLMACGFPFTIGIGFDRDPGTVLKQGKELSLCFSEKNSSGKLLGKIGLRSTASIRAGEQTVALFEPLNYSNYCLPKPWLWSRYLYYSHLSSSPQTAEMPLTARELRSMFVFYICPRPVVLATVCDGSSGNLFPLNLMGPVGSEYFCFALNSARAVTSTVERAREIALSSIPLEQSSLATELGKHHRLAHIDWAELPFPTTMSATLRVPVPEFALRVREMRIESTRKIGSHTLFVARILYDERRREGLEFFVIHGIYQARRQRALGAAA